MCGVCACVRLKKKFVLNTSFLYLVLFRTANVAKKLEMSWSQPVGMLYKQEKLLVRHAF